MTNRPKDRSQDIDATQSARALERPKLAPTGRIPPPIPRRQPPVDEERPTETAVEPGSWEKYNISEHLSLYGHECHIHVEKTLQNPELRRQLVPVIVLYLRVLHNKIELGQVCLSLDRFDAWSNGAAGGPDHPVYCKREMLLREARRQLKELVPSTGR